MDFDHYHLGMQIFMPICGMASDVFPSSKVSLLLGCRVEVLSGARLMTRSQPAKSVLSTGLL